VSPKPELNLSALAESLSASEIRLLDVPSARRAAVAAVLREGEAGVEILLIRRTVVEGDPWSGHMAFPGGTSEPEDDDLLHTARRETMEEVGLDLFQPEVQLLGRLDEIQAVGGGVPIGLIVSPFVFRLEGSPVLTANHEVDQVFWAPLDPMHRGDREASLIAEYQGDRYEMSGYQVGEHIVWGLTYYMIQHLLALFTGRPLEIDPRSVARRKLDD